ncbi:MAG: lectin-like protein [Kofleriaceae bacterium]
MRRELAVLLGLAAGCAEARKNVPVPDAAPPADAAGCAGGAAPTTWYTDADGDGFGDDATAVVACTQPAGTVAEGGDCGDDDDAQFPGATEVCDGVDTDCNAATVETCPAACVPERRTLDDGVGVYLFCPTVTSWTSASLVCDSQGYHLVAIDDADEQLWVRQMQVARLGTVDVYLGGSDAAGEGVWVWPTGAQFWMGGQGGMPAPAGAYANWGSGEPNNDGNEDCAVMRGNNGTWDDRGCTDNVRYVCER